MTRTPSAALHVLRLEDRNLPATFGTPWLDAQHITLSFVQDGTMVDGQASVLFKTMSESGLTESQWKQVIVNALQAWASQTNVNVSVVGDSWAALGTAGASQGDTRFGDIRISARPIGTDAFAITTPPGAESGTRGGDIVINSNYRFGAESGIDLFTVMLQETGHALGLGNSENSSSVMFDSYLGGRSGLTAEDIAAIQEVYGVRSAAADTFLDDRGTNNTRSTATVLQTTAGYQTNSHYEAVGVVNSASDVDYYAITARTKADGDQVMTVAVRTRNLPSAPVLAVFDKDGKQVDAAIVESGNGIFTVRLQKIHGGETYFIAVVPPANMRSPGNYRLTVDFHTSSTEWNTDFKGRLDQKSTDSWQTWSVSESALRFMTLSAKKDSVSGVEMTIFSSTGEQLVRLVANPGETISAMVLLSAGKFEVRFRAFSIEGVPLGKVDYSVASTFISDSIGVLPTSTTTTTTTSTVPSNETEPATTGDQVVSGAISATQAAGTGL